MLNVFQMLGKITQKTVTVHDKKELEDFEFKTCEIALKFVQNCYDHAMLNFDHESPEHKLITVDYFKENFSVIIDFHNTEETYIVDHLNELKQFAQDC